MRDKNGSPKGAATRVAAEQHGAITIAQLIALGISRDAVKRSAWLIPAYRGVYFAGHEPRGSEPRFMAAVLACGPGAALSGFAAGHVYGIVKGSPPTPEVSTERNRRVQGVLVHRVRRLHALDVSVYRGIPIATVPKTIVDLASRVVMDELARLCHDAEVRYGTAAAQVDGVLERHGNAPGRARLHAIYKGDAKTILSKLEKAFLSLLQLHALPLPQTNKKEKEGYVDCRWPNRRLTVELDSFTYHHTRHAWQQDHRRARAVYARGDELRRYTWEDVMEDPTAMLAELRPLLTAPAGAPGSPS